MEQQRPIRRTRRRRRRSPLAKLFTFCLICFVLFMGISVFFRVSVIYVEGDTRYSREEIIRAAGVDYGARLLLLNSAAAESGIRSNLHHVETVEVNRRFPGRLEIAVQDATPLAAVWTDKGYLILDREGRVLTRGETEPAAGLIKIWGIVPILPVEGEVLALGEEGREKVQYLRALLSAIYQEGVAFRVESIDLSRAHDLRLSYDGRFEVHFGSNRLVNEKVRAMIRVGDALDEDEKGIIDLSQGRNAYFRPEGI